MSLSAEAQNRWIWAFLWIGVALRLTRYFLRFPLWEDEAMLATNFLERGYGDLLQPLNYCQVAPPLFLWCELAVTRLLGFSEYTLRLVPFLCGMASLVLFRILAGRLLRGTALLLAVAIFAVAYPMTRYAAEAKPYGCDLFLSLVMLVLLVEWLRRCGETRWLWWLAAIVGPAVGFSYPTVFVAGGISLVVGWVLLRERRRGRLPWLVFNLILVGSFLVLLAVNHSAVGEANQRAMEEVHWADTFPPLAHPVDLVVWLLRTHCGGMLGYPIGGPHWGSTFSAICCAAGVGVLAWRRQWLLLGILLSPLGLTFVAACLRRFPYGGHARMTIFMAPAFCMLISLGITAALAWAAGRRRRLAHAGAASAEGRFFAAETRPLAIALVLLTILGAAALARDLTHPYKSGTTLRAREFARWFWNDLAYDSELVCCETDLKENLSPETYVWGWSCLYLCNQRIYSPRHTRGEPPRWDSLSAEHPLRCVLFHSPKLERDAMSLERNAKALDRWLERQQADYRLVGRDRYPFPVYRKDDRDLDSIHYIEVFKFVPK
jgi:4-amino-4-deoxy-L-arabinose transferase-like glycosyltransferase